MKINIPNVVSLFDGVACARVALGKLGYKKVTYYASEIDKNTIEIALKNFPDIKHIGGVAAVNKFNYPHIAGGGIDLLIGGSPCQDLSIAGKRKGLSGERSGLFYDYLRIRDEMKPKYFVLENVNSMPKEARDEISDALGIQPVMINAALVSAQNRKRLFWVGKWNGKKYEQVHIEQPEDKQILLKDIIHETRGEKFDLEKYIVKGNHLTWISDEQRLKKKYANINGDKSITMTARQYASWNGQYLSLRVGKFNSGGQGDRIYSIDGKSVGLSALGGGRGAKTGLYLVNSVAQRGRNIVDGKRKDILHAKTNQRIEIGGDNAHTITSVQKDSLVMIVQKPRGKNKGGNNTSGKTSTMTSNSWEHNNHLATNGYIRRLTPTECCRLQCLPDSHTDGVSDNQAYKALGNAFNVDVVGHILKQIMRPRRRE